MNGNGLIAQRPRFTYPEPEVEAQLQDSELMVKLLKRLVVGRTPNEQAVQISSSQPWIVNYMDRKRLYLFSASSFVLTVEDLGNYPIPANTWVDVSFPQGLRAFAQGIISPFYVFVRATDDVLVQNGVQDVQNRSLEISLPAVAGANTYLLAPTDVSAYKYFSCQLPPQSNNLTVTFQLSNNGINFDPLTVTRADGTRGSSFNQFSGAQGGQFNSPIFFKYLAIQITVYSSGTLQGILELYTLPISPAQVGANISDSNGNPLVGNQSALNSINANNVSSTQTATPAPNFSARGVLVYINVTVIGTGSLVLHIQGKDVVSGNVQDLLVASTAITATGFFAYELYPGASGGGVTQAVSGVLPKDWQVQVVGANGSTFFVNYAMEM